MQFLITLLKKINFKNQKPVHEEVFWSNKLHHGFKNQRYILEIEPKYTMMCTQNYIKTLSGTEQRSLSLVKKFNYYGVDVTLL